MNSGHSTDRIVELDALRGFALFGILMVNILYFAWPWQGYFLESAREPGVLDQAVLLLIRFLFEGKFITLFSLLFGLGFAMMATSLRERELPFYRMHYRRALMLMCFGAAHILLLWAGDILLVYGACALVLPLFLNCNTSTLRSWIVALLAVPPCWAMLSLLLFQVQAQDPVAAADLRDARTTLREEARERLELMDEFYNASSFVKVFQARMLEYAWMIRGTLFGPSGLPYIMAMFLLGVLFGRRGDHLRIPELLPRWQWHLRWMLPAGGVLTLFYVYALHATEMLWLDLWFTLMVLFFVLATPLMALSWAVLFITAFRRLAGGMLMRGFTSVGRTALTNYLLQSLVATTLFYGYGLGWYGDLKPATLALVALAIYVGQMVISTLYLRHFRMGPLEWLWRLVTWMKLPGRISSS